MRTGKRWLAGVAAGALGAGLLVGFVATPANASTVAATSSPVRVTYAGTALERVPYASISWTASANLATGDTAVITLATAPTPAAQLGFLRGEDVGTPAAYTTSFTSATNVSLTSNNQSLAAYYNAGNGTTSALVAVAADTPGTYTGQIQAFRSGVATGLPATFSITTVGVPTSLALTPATQSVAVGGTASVTANLLTSTGARTQPLCVDTLTTAATPTGANPQAITTCTNGADNSMFDGRAVFTYVPTAAGSYTISVTPGGTLPSTGVSAQAVSVTAVGTIAPTGAVVAAPAVGISQANNNVYTEPTPIATSGSQTVTLNVATSVKDITFAVTGATPGAQVAYTVTDSTSLPAGVTNTAGTVTLGADSTGTFKVSAAAPFATAAATGSQYTVVIGVSGGRQATYNIQYGTTNTINVGNITLSPKAGTTSFVKTGEATSVKATVTNQFGLPLAGVVVASSPNASTGATGTTGADGTATIAVAAPTNPTLSTQTVTFTGNFAGTTTSATDPVTFIYNASGAPTSLTPATSAGSVAQSALATQYVDSAGNKTGEWAATSVTTQTQWMKVTATVGGASSGVPVTFSGTGVYFSTVDNVNLNNTNNKLGSITANTAGGIATVYAKATKTGTATITVTAGTLSQTIAWKVANQNTDARTVTISPLKQDAAGRATVEATVRDPFGNPTPNVSLNFAEVGPAIFLNGSSTLATATGPTGVVTVELSALEAGDSTVTVFGTWTGTLDSPVTGAPAAITSATGEIKWSSTQQASITISGTRATVSGKPGIKVEGTVEGIADGRTVKPFIRFPGQTTFTEGTARPVISGGDFTWQRKTGKRVTVYVTSDDGRTTSNRVTIQAN